MKTQQQQQAREMYFQTNMSKTEIAEKLKVNRRTIYQWSVAGDWEKLRTSARCMPSILAEKCYYLIGHFTDHLLSRDSFYQSVTKADADILTKLVNSVTKLKKGTTVSENMETFTLFLESIQQKDADLADTLIPHVDDFISARTAASTISTLDGFSHTGFKPFPEKDIMEKWQDEKDAEALNSASSHAHPTAESAAESFPSSAHSTSPSPSERAGVRPPSSAHSTSPSQSTVDTPPSSAHSTSPSPLESAGQRSPANYKTTFWKNQDKARQRKLAKKNRKAA